MINITVQNVIQKKGQFNTPSDEQFAVWANAANTGLTEQVELTIRIVDEVESASLNEQYRKKKSATNVLAFPFEVEKNVGLTLLGDLVICANIVANEARLQAKSEMEHWAHMVIHGVLHLQGYDHINTEQAEKMENLEIQILTILGYSNPYQVTEL